METRTFTVTDMTCNHCVASVTEEVGEVAGVHGVEVDLSAGSLTVILDRPVDDSAIRAAVEEAGYQVA